MNRRKINILIGFMGMVSGSIAMFMALPNPFESAVMLICAAGSAILFTLNLAKAYFEPEEDTEWLIGISGTEADNVLIYRAKATEDAIKKLLYVEVAKDRDKDPECWDHGTEAADEVCRQEDGSFYAYGCFDNYHIDYVARKMKEVESIA